MKKVILLSTVLILVLSINLYAQKRKEYHIPGHENVEEMIGYTHAIKVGKTLYISGIVDGLHDDMKTQMETIYQYLDETLDAYGMRPDNIIKENIYTTNLDELNLKWR